MPFAGSSAPGDRKNHRYLGGIDLLFIRNTDRPGEAAIAHTLPDPGGADAVDLGERDLGLGNIIPAALRHAGTIEPGRFAGPALG